MKKLVKMISAALCVVIVLSITIICSFAADNEILYDCSYDDSTKTISIAVSLDNPIGLEACDLYLVYDEDEYEYIDVEKASIGSDAMVEGGKAAYEKDLCTMAVIFINSCEKSHLNEDGKLYVATFKFKSLKETPDLEKFGIFTKTYSVGGQEMADEIKVVGNEKMANDYDLPDITAAKTPDTANKITKKSENKATTKSDTSWVVYAVASVIAVGAIAGIAYFSVSSGKKNKAENAGKETKQEEKE